MKKLSCSVYSLLCVHTPGYLLDSIIQQLRNSETPQPPKISVSAFDLLVLFACLLSLLKSTCASPENLT